MGSQTSAVVPPLRNISPFLMDKNLQFTHYTSLFVYMDSMRFSSSRITFNHEFCLKTNTYGGMPILLAMTVPGTLKIKSLTIDKIMKTYKQKGACHFNLLQPSPWGHH